MRHFFLPATITLALAVTGCSGSGGADAPLPQHNAAPSSASAKSAQRSLRSPLGATSIVPLTIGANSQVQLCAKPKDSAHAGCFATVRTDSVNLSALTDAVNGLTPRDLSLLYAYAAPGSQGSAGAGQSVAVVTVGDYAGAEADLGVYRSHFGLPACTTANGCFTKWGVASVNTTSGTGSSTSVSAHATTTSSTGWAAEADTDIELISAVCPNCKIALVEAATDSLADLSQAVSNASYSSASIINASFGAPESSVDLQYSWAYNNPTRNTKVVAAAGDWGYGVYYPASDSNVVAVGGTSLALSGSTVTETVWPGTGSGCSTYFANPGWQHPPAVWGACTKRNVADVAAVADPLTGVAIYDNSLYGSTGGWAIFGGTSIATPIITGMYALSGDTGTGHGAQTLYAASSGSFLQVTGGSNGACAPLYLCTAMSGYDGPSGLGIPQGLRGF